VLSGMEILPVSRCLRCLVWRSDLYLGGYAVCYGFLTCVSRSDLRFTVCGVWYGDLTCVSVSMLSGMEI
jgi:hypothetical protein